MALEPRSLRGEVFGAALETPVDLDRITSVYQPIVDLGSGEVVGFEALCRGPAGTGLELPDDLFDWARRTNRLAAVDWACRVAALRGALHAGLPPGCGLFVNVEPAVASSAMPVGFVRLVKAVKSAGLQVVVEVTERSLTRDPAALLRLADWVREQGWSLALDDVGSSPGSLALMPFLRPDIIKLDLKLVQHPASIAVAEVINAVSAQAARTGALVLAEGIENERHLAAAGSMGAALGQGWHFGGPTGAPRAPHARLAVPAQATAASAGSGPAVPDSPWQLVEGDPGIRRTGRPLLAAISRHLERQLLGSGEPGVVAASLQRADNFIGGTRQRFTALAEAGVVVAAVAAGLTAVPAPGVRGGGLTRHDPLRRQWTVAVVTNHFAAALIARECEDTVEGRAQYDYLVSYDRAVVVSAAEVLLRNLSDLTPAEDPEPGDGMFDVVPETVLAGMNRAQRRQLDQLLATSGAAVMVIDAVLVDLPIRYVNPATERLTGYSASELLGRDCRTLHGVETDPADSVLFSELLRSGRPGRVLLANHRRDGRLWWAETEVGPISDAEGATGLRLAVATDVTDRVGAERRYARLAGTDQLTGVATRVQVQHELQGWLNRSSSDQRPSTPFLLALCEIHGLGRVNREAGRAAGDALLVAAAAALRRTVPAGSVVARYGDHEFVVLLRSSGAQARQWGEVSAAVRQATEEHGVGLGVGLARFPQDGGSAEQLLAAAEAAARADRGPAHAGVVAAEWTENGRASAG